MSRDLKGEMEWEMLTLRKQHSRYWEEKVAKYKVRLSYRAATEW